MANALAPNRPDEEEDFRHPIHPDIGPDTHNFSLPGNELDSVRQGESNPGLYNPNGDASAESEALQGSGGSQGGLASDEFDKNNGKPQNFLSRFRMSRRKAILGTGAVVGLGGTGAVIFLLMIPLKIEHIVTNLENRFFATSTNAIQNQTDSLLKGFIKGPLADAMKLQNSTCSHEGKMIVSKGCTLNVVGNGNNPVVNLYKTWAQARIEDQLADRGLEIKYRPSSGEYFLKAPGLNGDQKVGTGSIGSEFDKVNRNTVRTTFLTAEKDMTSWDKVMYRYKVGRLLEQKYGIKRCIVFCGTRDALTDSVNNKKYAAKMFLVERVITPRSASMGAIVDCLINQNCDTKTTNSTCSQSTCDELANEPTTMAVTESEQEVGKVTAGFGSETADKLIGNIKDIRDAGGMQKYLLNKILEKFNATSLTDFASGAISSIPTLANILTALSNLGHDAKMLNYVVNSTAAVSAFALFRTFSDEIHTGSDPGKVDASEVGSFVDSLGSGSQCATPLEGSCGPQLGGMAGAESTPLYSNLFGDGSSNSSTASLIDNLLPSKAYAASSTSDTSYKCGANADQPVPAGQLVCPEEVLGSGNKTATDISNLVNGPLGPITTAAKFLHGAFGPISQWAGNIMGGILNATGISNATSFITGPITKFSTNLLEGAVVQNPFSNDIGGGRNFDMLVAGADVAGSDFAHTGLGGKRVSATVAGTFAMNQEDQARQEFSRHSFFARMFDTNSQYSLVSTMSMKIPFNVQGSMENSFASFISNPFSSLLSNFSSIFSGHALATGPTAVVNGKDVFGVTQYEPETVDNPEAYWDTNCTDDPSTAYQRSNAWNTEAANSDTGDPSDESGMPYNTSANPCLTIHATLCAAGAVSDTSNCSQDDLADIGQSPASILSVGGYTNPFPDGWVPGRLDMGYDGTFTNKIVSPCSGKAVYVYPDTAHDSNGGWEGAYMAIQCSGNLPGMPANTFYFAEGLSPTVPQGASVSTGQEIAVPGWTGYSEGPGGIEWGLASSNPGTTQAAALGNSCTVGSASQKFVMNFSQWVQQNLGVKPPSSTDHAGCA